MVFFQKSFLGIGVLFTLIRIIDFFFPNCGLDEVVWFIIIAILSGIYGVWKARPCSKVVIPIPLTNSVFEIKFGDIFKNDGVTTIPVNEYFDHEIGDRVSEDSLHGQFILKILKGNTEKFRYLVDTSLKGKDSVIKERKDGKKKSFEIGTVSKIDFKDRVYLLAALAHTDPHTFKASATTIELGKCLKGIWEAARTYSQGSCVVIPLIGSGLSGIGLPHEYLIQTILISFFESTKEKQVTGKLILVLDKKHESEINLNAIKDRWR